MRIKLTIAALLILLPGIAGAQSLQGVGNTRITGDCTGAGSSSINVSCPPNLSNAVAGSLVPTTSYQYPTIVRPSGYFFAVGDNGQNILYEAAGAGTFSMFDTNSGGLNSGVTFEMTNASADLSPLTIVAPGGVQPVQINGITGSFTMQYGQTWLFTTDGTNYFASLAASFSYLPNLAGAGQTANLLVRVNSTGRTTVVTAGATDGAIGIRMSDGTSASTAMVTTVGIANCVFDNTTTAGHWVTISASVNGDCTDTGLATRPTTSQPIGLVVDAGGAGVHRVMLQIGGTGGGGAGTVSSVAPGAGLTSSTTCVSGTTTPITASGTLCPDAAYRPLYMSGYQISNDSGTPTTVMDVAAGVATSDDGTYTIKGLAITKNANAAFVAGSGNGCLDIGSTLGVSVWYQLYVIANTTSGATDALCSLATNASPTLPAGFGVKRRVGSFKTDGSNHILAFKEPTFPPDQPRFYWAASTLDINTAALGTTAALQALNVPPGVKVQPFCYATISNAGTAAVLLSSPDEPQELPTVTTPFSAAPGFGTLYVNTGAHEGNGICPPITTNTSQQIFARSSAASTTLAIVTTGWLDSFAALPPTLCPAGKLDFSVPCQTVFYTIGVN